MVHLPPLKIVSVVGSPWWPPAACAGGVFPAPPPFRPPPSCVAGSALLLASVVGGPPRFSLPVFFPVVLRLCWRCLTSPPQLRPASLRGKAGAAHPPRIQKQKGSTASRVDGCNQVIQSAMLLVVRGGPQSTNFSRSAVAALAACAALRSLRIAEDGDLISNGGDAGGVLDQPAVMLHLHIAILPRMHVHDSTRIGPLLTGPQVGLSTALPDSFRHARASSRRMRRARSSE